MAEIYGSITMVDMGDLGQLSVVPESNQPTMVIYNPDSNTYLPDWSQIPNLNLKPVIYYGGDELFKKDHSSLEIKWEKKDGSKATALGPFEVVNENTGELKVSANPFLKREGEVTPEWVTYVVRVTYIEPNTGSVLKTAGQISYGLIQNAEEVKTLKIIGESAFLLDNKQDPKNADIQLNAIAKGALGTLQWAYKDKNGKFQDIPKKNESFLDINYKNYTLPNQPYFFNDQATFRIYSKSNPEVYDEHTISIIKDGASGDSVVAAILTNDSQMIPCDADNNPNFNGATTTLTILEGAVDVTNSWTIKVSLAGGVTCKEATNSRTQTVTGMAEDVGSVTFECTRDGYDTIYKKFSLAKIKTGKDGQSPIIYGLEISNVIVKKSEDGKNTPDSIIIKAYSQVGEIRDNFLGDLELEIDGQKKPVISLTQYEKGYSLSTKGIKNEVVVSLLKSKVRTASSILDQQSIIIVSDGKKGETPINFNLGNSMDVLPCNNDGLLAEDTTVEIPYAAYKNGLIACTATCDTKGLLTQDQIVIKPGSDKVQGKIILTFEKGMSLGNKDSGAFTVKITANKTEGTFEYRWTKNKAALDGRNGIDGRPGQNAVLFQIYAPYGNIINNKDNDVRLIGILTDGAKQFKDLPCQWYRQDGDKYTIIEGATKLDYTIGRNEIDSALFLKCEVTYNDITYNAFCSVYDRKDPLQVVLYSTLGEKITNGQGKGCIYALVYQNSREIDKLQNLIVSETKPIAPIEGDVWVEIGEKKVTVKHFVDFEWIEYTDLQFLVDYTWTFIGENVPEELKKQSKQKFLYIDANLINRKTQFYLEVNYLD